MSTLWPLAEKLRFFSVCVRIRRKKSQPALSAGVVVVYLNNIEFHFVIPKAFEKRGRISQLRCWLCGRWRKDRRRRSRQSKRWRPRLTSSTTLTNHAGATPLPCGKTVSNAQAVRRMASLSTGQILVEDSIRTSCR